MKAQRFPVIAVLVLVGALTLLAQSKKLTAAQAKDHIGERATVCGKVASARYADRTKWQPTFLNLDKPYPKQVFTIVIWGDNRQKFGDPESKYMNKSVCVTGKITEFKGAPEAVATDPAQIEIQ